MKRILCSLVLLMVSTACIFAQTEEKTTQDSVQSSKHQKFTKKDYIPKFTATVLGRYEYNTGMDAHHFELRHTRIGVSGSVHPMFSYMALVDLTYGGAFSPVAIFAQFKPVKGLSFLIGFDKMPFSSENLLSPYNYYFSDKSFLTSKLSAWADVGGVVCYKWDKVVPFEIKAGVFNSAGFSRQMQFQKTMNYVVRTSFEPFPKLKLTFDYAGVQPEAVRIHNFDFEVAYDIANLHLETEYIYRIYKEQVCAPTHAVYGFACYKIPVGKKFLDNIAVAARYDAISPSTKGVVNADGLYDITPFCQRITAGLTMIFVEKPVRAGIRLNYEKFFYHKDYPGKDDRVILEFITHI